MALGFQEKIKLKSFDNTLNCILHFIFQYLSNSSRVGHRNRLNIFDVIKVINVLKMNPIDLKKYIKWTNSFESKIILREIISKDFDGFLTEYNLDLTFGIDVNEIKRPGFEFLPPTPSSFTFKFSPVITKICILYHSFAFLDFRKKR